MMTINIYKDNEGVKTFENADNDFPAFKWLLDHQSQSTNYAIKYGVYKVELIDNKTGKKDYYK